MKSATAMKAKLDAIGEWSELKLEIMRKYAGAYTRILKAQGLHPIYADGFAGAGIHLSKNSKDIVPGSPLNALHIIPPFEELHLIDLDSAKVSELRGLTRGMNHVHVYGGDANEILLKQVFPTVSYQRYERALCVLDPYALDLDWRVIETAGKMGTVEIFLNFPMMDMNRSVLWWNPEQASAEQQRKLTTYWGDETWRKIAYASTPGLFGDMEEKQPNEVIAEAFRRRLRDVAGFKYVPQPVPMRNSRSSTVYYLFFAAQKETAQNILVDILSKYHREGVLQLG